MALSAARTQVYGTSAVAITKSDTATFPPSIVYVGTTGNASVYPADQEGKASPTAVLFTGLPAGAVIPCMCIAVLSTSTTAGAFVRIA